MAGTVPLAAAVACSAEGDTTLERARNAGVLRVGLSGERPYGYVDFDGGVTGAQPEMARAVLARLGVGGLAAVQVPFDRLIPGLQSGQSDMITAGMTVTPRRCTEVAFSRPDFLAPPAFLVREGNPREIETFEDVARSDSRLAVLDGSIEQEYAQAAGVPEEQLVTVDDQRLLLRVVADGDATAGALTAISLRDVLSRNPGVGLEVTEPFQPSLGGRVPVPAGAFAVRSGDTELLNAFDEELAALHRSGEWLRITEPFGFTPSNLPPPGLTTAELCNPG